MLTTLRIKNLALVTDLTLELRPGYNAITGETGAGKSVIIGALNLVTGERADRSMIRSGSDACSVEAVVDVSKVEKRIQDFLAENGFEACESGELILRRTFSVNGANRQFINGSPAALQALSELGDLLVDMHGPHEHHSLLNPSRQLELVDAHAGLTEVRIKLGGLAARWQSLEREKLALVVDERQYAQQIDLLRFQSQEIEAARLDPEHEEILESEFKKASNASALLQISQSALGLLNENEASLISSAGGLGRLLRELERLDSKAGCLISLHEQALDSWRDLLADLSNYAEGIDLNSERLAALQEQLDLIQSLKRKYGPSLEDVIAFGEQARAKLDALLSRDEELGRLQSAMQDLEKQLEGLSGQLSAARAKSLPKLSRAVQAELADLGFKQSRFEPALARLPGGGHSTRWGSGGLDTMEFLFSPNKGEPLKPLRSIASSGEMARVMLALKTVLANEDESPILIFDEVDANVGGETASAVGAKMRQIGANHQVLCITHLAPVAAVAESHYLVTKEERGGRTVSEISLLEVEDRVRELARMLGGHGETALLHARALLNRPA